MYINMKNKELFRYIHSALLKNECAPERENTCSVKIITQAADIVNFGISVNQME